MSLIGEAITSMSPDEILKLIQDYSPVIIAIVSFIEQHKDDKKRALALDGITRGLQYAKETGDTAELEAAIRAHNPCAPIP
jgi:hypothetical protein